MSTNGKEDMHAYAGKDVTGVCLAATYDGDIDDALGRWRKPLDHVERTDERVFCRDQVLHDGSPVLVTVSYGIKPEGACQIVLTALGNNASVDETALQAQLEKILEATGIKAQPSKAEQFAELFSSWEETYGRASPRPS